MKLNPKVTAALASYGRSFISAAAALWVTGNTDPKGLIAAGLVAVIPVALRALNPKDPAFGLITRIVLPEITKQLTAILDSSNKKAAKKAATPKKK